MDIEKKLDMAELGTRYAHYTELRDFFATAQDIIANMHTNLKNKTDDENYKKLETVVDYIDRRIAYLTDYERLMSRWGNIARQIDASAPSSKLLTGEANGTKETDGTSCGTDGQSKSVKPNSEEPPFFADAF